MLKKLKYMWLYIKISRFEDKIDAYFFTDFNATKRVTMWYIAGRNKGYKDAIDYAFFKVYHLWGTDGLSDSEKVGF